MVLPEMELGKFRNSHRAVGWSISATSTGMVRTSTTGTRGTGTTTWAWFSPAVPWLKWKMLSDHVFALNPSRVEGQKPQEFELFELMGFLFVRQ